MESQRHVLHQRFLMPTSTGSIDAVAVSSGVSKMLQSLYAVMLQSIIFEMWALVVLVGMALAVKRSKMTHNIGVANVAIWNLQSSPLSVLKAMFEHYWHAPAYATLWMTLALTTLLGSVVLSAFISPNLIIGQAAPVNPSMVFVPQVKDYTKNKIALSYTTLGFKVPASLRAVSSLDAVNPATGRLTDLDSMAGKVNFTVTKTPSVFPNETFEKIDWSYVVTGVDFGMQHAPDLVHKVTGSCYTEYDWFKSSNGSNGTIVDSYTIAWPDGTTKNLTASQVASKAPVLSAYLPKTPDPDPATTNVSFAVLVSSVQRMSFTPNDDPCYYTNRTGGSLNITGIPQAALTFSVLPGRPMLSCWQQDLWTHKNQTTSIAEIDKLTAIPPALVIVLQSSLVMPRITNLISELGSIAAKSSIGTTGSFFDASKASVGADMQRLVLGSYVATKNILAETTLYKQDDKDLGDNIQNGVYESSTGEIIPGVGDFVVYGSDFAAISVRVLVIVPCILIGLNLFVFLLSSNSWISWPWNSVHAMDATVLYNHISSANPGLRDVENQGMANFASTAFRDPRSPAVVRPTWDKESSSVNWSRTPSRDG